MADAVKKTLSFVMRHDIDPTNDRAEEIPAHSVTPALLEAYGREVLSTLSPGDTGAFHKANEVLFKFIPPQKRLNFMFALEKRCSLWSTSAACETAKWKDHRADLKFDCLDSSIENEMLCLDAKKDNEGLLLTKDANSAPALTEANHADFYHKIQWFIAISEEKGEVELANVLRSALNDGRIRYIEDLKMARAWFDLRSNSIVLSRSFFEWTWADYIRGADGRPVIVSDDEVVKWAEESYGKEIRKRFGGLGKITLNDLERISEVIPKLKPSWIKKRLALKIKKEATSRTKKYFRNTKLDIFPRNMPFWIFGLPHEARHIMQNFQDESEWTPKWAKGRNLKNEHYYSALERVNLTMLFNQPALQAWRAVDLLREPGVRFAVNTRNVAYEREATEFAIKIAAKVKKDMSKRMTKGRLE